MAIRATMNVSLTPELEEFVAARVRSGRYLSASEVVRDGLRMLQVRELALEDLRRKVAVGLAEADRGELLDGEEVFAELEKRYAEWGQNGG